MVKHQIGSAKATIYSKLTSALRKTGVFETVLSSTHRKILPPQALAVALQRCRAAAVAREAQAGAHRQQQAAHQKPKTHPPHQQHRRLQGQPQVAYPTAPVVASRTRRQREVNEAP